MHADKQVPSAGRDLLVGDFIAYAALNRFFGDLITKQNSTNTDLRVPGIYAMFVRAEEIF
jgi:hypothetical protein